MSQTWESMTSHAQIYYIRIFHTKFLQDAFKACSLDGLGFEKRTNF